MSGRRLHPDPVMAQPITELVDPALAQPIPPSGAQMGSGPAQNPGFGPQVGTPPMIHPAMLQAQQDAAAAAQGIPGFQPASEPFMKLHNDDQPAYEGQEGATPQPESEPVTELTPAELSEFSNLLTIGRRSKMIDVYGHPVFVENLSVGDDQRIGRYCKEFQGAPPADTRSYQIAVVACGVRTIDGQALYQKLSEEEDDEAAFQARVAKVTKLYPPVVSKIYRAIQDLDLEFAELEAKLGKRNG